MPARPGHQEAEHWKLLEGTHLWPCWAISMALRAGTGEPPSVTLSTSMDLRSGRRLPWRFSIGESTRFRGGSVCRQGSGPGLGLRGAAWGQTTRPPCTYFISGGQVLVLVARVPFFPVQEKEINHLLLVLPAGWGGEAARGLGKSVPGGGPAPRPAQPQRPRTPRTAGPAEACCGPGSSPASACCLARRGRCPPGWAASGSAPCGGWAALAPARSCPLCGRQAPWGHSPPLPQPGPPPPPPQGARTAGPTPSWAPSLTALPVPSPCTPPASCPSPAQAGPGPWEPGAAEARAGPALGWVTPRLP